MQSAEKSSVFRVSPCKHCKLTPWGLGLIECKVVVFVVVGVIFRNVNLELKKKTFPVLNQGQEHYNSSVNVYCECLIPDPVPGSAGEGMCALSTHPWAKEKIESERLQKKKADSRAARFPADSRCAVIVGTKRRTNTIIDCGALGKPFDRNGRDSLGARCDFPPLHPTLNINTTYSPYATRYIYRVQFCHRQDGLANRRCQQDKVHDTVRINSPHLEAETAPTCSDCQAAAYVETPSPEHNAICLSACQNTRRTASSSQINCCVTFSQRPNATIPCFIHAQFYIHIR